jgi:hypothetical protein
MKLVPHWRRVLRKAWSARLSLAGAVFAGGAMALPAFMETVSPRAFLAMCMVCCVGAVLARVVDQPKMRGDDGD